MSKSIGKTRPNNFLSNKARSEGNSKENLSKSIHSLLEPVGKSYTGDNAKYSIISTSTVAVLALGSEKLGKSKQTKAKTAKNVLARNTGVNHDDDLSLEEMMVCENCQDGGQDGNMSSEITTKKSVTFETPCKIRKNVSDHSPLKCKNSSITRGATVASDQVIIETQPGELEVSEIETPSKPANRPVKRRKPPPRNSMTKASTKNLYGMTSFQLEDLDLSVNRNKRNSVHAKFKNSVSEADPHYHPRCSTQKEASITQNDASVCSNTSHDNSHKSKSSATCTSNLESQSKNCKKFRENLAFESNVKYDDPLFSDWGSKYYEDSSLNPYGLPKKLIYLKNLLCDEDFFKVYGSFRKG